MEKRSKKHKTINQTFSIPADVSQDLHVYVKRREMSRFVTEALRKELLARKLELGKHYALAEKDPGELEVRSDWDGTIQDGLEEW